MPIADVIQAAQALQTAQNGLDAQQSSLKELDERHTKLKEQIRSSKEAVDNAKATLKKAVADFL